MPERLIDVPLESLAFVDEQHVEIAARPETTWDALIERLGRAANSRAVSRTARVLGAIYTEPRGDVGEIGSLMPGFVVSRSVRPAVLALMGQHRFARYALIFQILEKPSGLTLLSAQTRADFPGARGRVYRALVIGTRGHVVALRRLLRGVRRRAERTERGLT